jgi:hypothetical protein
MGTLLQDARYGLRNLVRTPRLHCRRDVDVGAWWQSQRYHLQRNVIKALPFPEPDRLRLLWETFGRARTI